MLENTDSVIPEILKLNPWFEIPTSEYVPFYSMFNPQTVNWGGQKNQQKLLKIQSTPLSGLWQFNQQS